ncbi:capsular exopolysaccharide family [Saccharicrinis carchari]|uniref:non-specific protein-tyrosine kinase n=1 Tax=Saccharicrinis carchari TaxID=1168039 RepID=A0A521BCZ8_SACCC|nr:polysaccharide biosynthesis tyrosine autokinase [Saccharicrinis carchari]SMO44967.1 capsular exopolysaccharide family [Saccharicrinis carchari]
MQKHSDSNYSHSKAPVTESTMPDIRKIFQLFKKNWYFLLISFPLFTGLTYIYHRYTPVVYKGSVTIMLKSDEKRTVSGAEIIEGFGLSPETKSIENQTIILRSKKIVKRAIDRLDFAIDIYSNGVFKDTDMYQKSPFVITMDSSHVQLLNTPIHIEPIDESRVKISIKTENATLHTFANEKNQGASGAVTYEKIVKIGDWIDTPFCRFTIHTSSALSSQVGYYFYFRSHDWLAAAYRGKIQVSPYKEGSSIIYISSTGTNPHKINAFLDALTFVYLEQSLERKNEIAKRTIAFIETQLKQVADTLRQAQRKMIDFKRNNVFSAPTELSERLAERYFEYEKQLGLLQVSESYYTRLSKHLESEPLSDDYLLPIFSIESNAFVTSLVTELLGLHNELSLLQAQTNTHNPLLAEMNQKINLSKQNLLVALHKILKNVALEKKKIKDQMSHLAARMNDLPENERLFLDIERDYKLNDAIYTFLLQKKSETQITKASNTPDNEILDDASIVGVVSPNKSKNKQQAILLAFLLPVGIVVLKEYLNNKIRDRNDLTSLAPRTTILGYIPQYKGTGNMVIKAEPLSSTSESFRALRTKLKYLTPENGKLVLTITSTNTGEGKTFCALNLASAFAISGKKTVLVGFDLRKPRLTELFRHENEQGLSNYLIGQAQIDEIMYPGGADNFTIVPSGTIPPNPSELISGIHTQRFFTEIKEIFDVVIVDSPPIGLVADARLLLEYSDCHLFVVRANKTVKEQFKHTLQNLMDDEVPPTGIVLNDLNSKIGGYGYYSEKYYTDSKKA